MELIKEHFKQSHSSSQRFYFFLRRGFIDNVKPVYTVAPTMAATIKPIRSVIKIHYLTSNCTALETGKYHLNSNHFIARLRQTMMF